jgi:preprotein translocase subunit SecD
MKNTLTRWSIVVVALIAAIYALTPTYIDWSSGSLDGKPGFMDGVASYFVEPPATEGQEATWKGRSPLTLGLDLQGGLLLQYHVYVDRAVQDRLERIERDISERLENSRPGINVEVRHLRNTNHIDITFANASDRDLLDDDFMGHFQQLNRIDMGAGRIRLSMDEDYIDETKGFAVEQAIETIRSRIDALGVAEPSIARQGLSDIVVQLPGISDEHVDRAKRLIGQTAQLRFQMVDDSGTNTYFNQFRGQLPEGFALRSIDGGYLSVTHQDKEMLERYFEGRYPRDRIIGYQHHPVYIDRELGIIDEMQSYWKTYLIYRETEVTGDYIQDARVAIDQQFNRPYVAMNFDARGAELFAVTTTENVGQRFAIMMDDIVVSAPVINEPITGGRARITLGSMRSFTEIQEEAQDLVISLRHGALPAPLELQFETLVGPTLGQDSIDSSIRALIVGSLLVILFMLLYYRASGAISTIALTMNLVFIMAGLAFLGATLTLPGFAGIILTVGMAVDANVIIYERIREEYVLGKPMKESVNEGFAKAYSAVFDANITTGLAALVLMHYGTGPIRGFAVTLLIGIFCTLFTAVYVTRLFFVEWMHRTKKTKLSI